MLKQIAVFRNGAPFANIPWTGWYYEITNVTGLPKTVAALIYLFCSEETNVVTSYEEWSWQWKEGTPVMEVEVHFIVVTDANGDKDWDVVRDCTDNVCVSGIDKRGQYQQFDSCEAYHVHKWAESYGFTTEIITKKIIISP